MTTWPNLVKSMPVSLTTSPVTQVADVDVNSALMNSSGFPLVFEIGSIRSTVPSIIIAAKPSTRIWGGDSLGLLNFKTCSPLH
ncbi:hypothetical protein D3C72_970750 [compost metagenome]